MRIALPRRFRGRRRTVALVAAAAVLIAGAGAYAALAGGSPPVREQVLAIAGTPEPDGRPVSLDATLYLPAGSVPAPAVVLAHGFGGSKDDEADDARYLAQHGYVVLAYSARGFGRSGGLIHVDSLDYEVRDAERVVDLLAARPEVLKDKAGDPRVGFSGPSYGGALSLLVAGADPRVDAIAPQITWNDLGHALFGQSVQDTATPGVFKKVWAGLFFGTGSASSAQRGGGSAASTSADSQACGRFAPDVCAAYQATAAGDGTPTPALLDLLAGSSPARVLDRVTAPTLLIQGESDSLFGLDQADANARGLAAHGTPVQVAWYGGGHDAAATDAQTARLRGLTLAWFDRYLKRDGSAADTRFSFDQTGTSLSLQDGTVGDTTMTAPGYPGLPGGAPAGGTEVALHGGPQSVVAPAGGYPAATSALPGLSGLLSQAGALGAAGGGGGGDGGGLTGGLLDGPADQQAVFSSAPLPATIREVGAGQVTLHVAPTGGATDATLFAKLYDVSRDSGRGALPAQLVAPIRLTGLTAAGTDVTVALPGVVHDFQAGDRLRLVVTTTDQAYQLPNDPRAYVVSLAGSGAVALPEVPATAAADASAWVLWAIGALLALLLLAAAGFWLRGRRAAGQVGARTGTGTGTGGTRPTQPTESTESAGSEESADATATSVPVVVDGLGKAYGDGFRAVSDLSLTVGRGQVLGLLGPNGAGKTTTLRMLVGLIAPTEGAIRVFGHRITPGAPVLSRVGAFIEGPGFLPHLSGLDNLTLYWAATGRPAADADIDAALELAGLGSDVHRKVRTYSQGMRQRLAVAQAMLGLPDLLVLDEPTNGLDPPQIREMREALRRYAATGRTVVVSSHLLAEVEQTCTHVAVMAKGRLLAAGPVAELVGTAASVRVDVDRPAEALPVAAKVPGVRDARAADDRAIELDLDPDLARAHTADVVRALVEAGLAVEGVAPRRRLEDVFLDLVHER